MNRTATVINTAVALQPPAINRAAADWRLAVPVLAAGDVVLREVETDDAESLVALLTTPEITRFISEPPSTAEGFSRFIAASQRLRAAGRGVCFAVTLRGCDTAIGIVQVRRLDPVDGPEGAPGSIDRAEWGFAIGSPFWGGGIFTEAAGLVLAFVFEEMHVRRLEARAAVRNGRAARALRRVGAQAEGLLRNGLFRAGEYLDQTLYAIDVNGWRVRQEQSAALVH